MYHAQYNEIKTWVSAFKKHYQNMQLEIQACIDTTQNSSGLYFCLKPVFPDTIYIQFKKNNLKVPADCLLPSCAAPVTPSYHLLSPPAVLDLPQWQETTFFFYSQEIIGN